MNQLHFQVIIEFPINNAMEMHCSADCERRHYHEASRNATSPPYNIHRHDVSDCICLIFLSEGIDISRSFYFATFPVNDDQSSDVGEASAMSPRDESVSFGGLGS